MWKIIRLDKSLGAILSAVSKNLIRRAVALEQGKLITKKSQMRKHDKGKQNVFENKEHEQTVISMYCIF